MMLRDRPLLVDGIDAAVYVSRAIQASLWSAVAAGRNTLLLGEPGTGKTTLLRWLRARLREADLPCAFVNASLATDVFSFAELVGDALEEAFAPKNVQIGPPFKSGETVPRTVRLLYEVRRLMTPEPVVLLVDGLADPDIAHDWFGRLRDEVWALGHTWALAARPSQSARLRTPPADAFWSAVLEVGPLSHEERRALLEHGLDPEERARIAESQLPTSATPRELITFLHGALDDSTPEDSDAWRTVSWRHDRAAALGRSECSPVSRQRVLCASSPSAATRTAGPASSTSPPRIRWRAYEPASRRRAEGVRVADETRRAGSRVSAARAVRHSSRHRHDIGGDVIEIVDLRAISVLEGLYIEHENDLRWVLNLAATAAGIAAEAGSERVDDTHVFEAQKTTPN